MIQTSQHHTPCSVAPLEGPARFTAPSAYAAVPTRCQDETAGDRQAYYAWNLAQEVQRYYQLLAQQQAMRCGAAPSGSRAFHNEVGQGASTDAPRTQVGTPRLPCSHVVSSPFAVP